MTGDAGSVTQTFSYDALNRLTGSSGLAAGTVSYTYDLDGNRLTRSVGPDTYAAVYDRTDELVSISRNGGFALTASYTATGDLTADPETGTSGSTIAYAYDLAHRLTSITPAGGPTTTLALDALGRPLTRTTGSSVDTYSYLGTTDTVVRIANTGGTGAVTDSISDPAGDRLGTKTGSTVAWLTPDLHGSIAAGLAQTAGSVTDAIRYDGYGQTVAVWPSGGSPATSSWKYQGRLDLSPSSIPLYAAGARDYAPGLGMFTSLDTFAGSAQDPLSMNRFLYAEANPATLIDPSGHMAQTVDGGGADPTTETVCRYPCGPTISATDTVREAASHSVANRTSAASVMAQAPAALAPTFDDAYHQCMSGFAGLGGDAFGGKSCTQTALAQSGASIPESLLRTMLSGLPQFAFMAGGATAIDVAPGLVAAAGSAAADKVVADPAGSARTAGQVICGAVGSCVGGELTVPTGPIAYGELDSLGRPTGVAARLTANSIAAGGSPALSKIRPPGFLGGAAGQARGHLLGNQLGGSGADPRNLITIFQNPANSPAMRGVENQIRALVEQGQVVDYSVIPIYLGSEPVAVGITLRAQGDRGFIVWQTILNRGR